jgi:hypothetical protein
MQYKKILREITAPEVLNPKIVLWLFLNQFISDFNSETAGTSKLIPIHLDPW